MNELVHGLNWLEDFDDHRFGVEYASSRLVAITGHRPSKLGGFNTPKGLEIQTRVRRWIEGNLLRLQKKYEGFRLVGISGMALGVDQWFSESCISLGIPFIAACPFPAQASKWPKESQDHWVDLCSRAERVIFISPNPYTAQKMQTRNIWMVDHSNELLAVWDGSSGGTGNCIRYAEDQQRIFTRCDPRDFNEYLR